MACRSRKLAAGFHREGVTFFPTEIDQNETCRQLARTTRAGGARRLAEEARRRVSSSIACGTSARLYTHVTASSMSVAV